MAEQIPNYPPLVSDRQEHPFRLVSSDERGLELYSPAADRVLHASHPTGRILLAIGPGMHNEKTMQQVRQEVSAAAPEEHQLRISDGVLYKARRMSSGLAPDIVTHRLDSETRTVYYKDVPSPEDREEDFAHWDDGLHIRYDLQKDYLVVSHDGQRIGARIEGRFQKAIWRFLATTPERPLTRRELSATFPDEGIHPDAMYHWLRCMPGSIGNRLGLDPALLVERSTVRSPSQHNMAGYTLRANAEVTDEVQLFSKKVLDPQRDKIHLSAQSQNPPKTSRPASPVYPPVDAQIASFAGDGSKHPFREIMTLDRSTLLYSVATEKILKTSLNLGQLLLAMVPGIDN